MNIDLRLGDCLELMEDIPDGSVDAVITDPLYTTPAVTAYGRTKDRNVADLSIQETYLRVLRQGFERILKPCAPTFIFCDDDYFASVFRAFYTWSSNQLIIWDKGRIGLGKPFRKRHELLFYVNRHGIDYNRTDGITHYPTVLCYKPVPPNERMHGAQKPLDMIEDLIKGFTNESDTVLDCFMGSGTTGVACAKLNRNFIGMEINPDYFEIAKSRIYGTSVQAPSLSPSPALPKQRAKKESVQLALMG